MSLGTAIIHVRDFFFSNMDKTRDTVRAEEQRCVALAHIQKDYPHILLTLVIIYLLYIILVLLSPSPTRSWLCCNAVAVLHRRGIHCTALLEIQMY